MSDCCSAPGLMSLDDAIASLTSSVSPISETELISLADCDGRVLAENITSPINVPSHDNSAMDGYALRAADIENSDILPLAGQSFAGHPFEETCPEGHCIRIMTGASVPTGTDTVIMQEKTEKADNGIRFLSKASVGNNVRRAGEDISTGSQVLESGHKLRPQDLGLLASLGVASVKVYKKVKVAVFSTGDELKLPGEPLGHGDIYDSNRIIIISLLNRLGVEVIDLGKLPDDRSVIRDALIRADQEADVVITSGGVSVGEADYIKEILEELGEIGFWKLAIKPGKPFAFGQLPNSVFFGLPGNPVSATVTLHVLATAAIRVMTGETYTPSVMMKACTQTPLKKAAGRREFQRGILSTDENGSPVVVTTGSQGSGILRSMNMANCYIVLPEASTGAAVGDSVQVITFDKLLS
ncbi:molybdopterin molybdotransferase MoeA [Sansalvadorimonas sp. 2012CJ34-2]|uniref:Molybdopterin molybdenumtransferase n=1 Tax=Parendozoicomonas callyspongiae TaxID=2942213 RepID=A0ABT0PIZ8_9GAMM|nr:molybdopterin molybdotransferase MoeA [Sansalvadorimonas sp. 2012CJ34-2]MCL6271367.1 molybdopterin molybdotransferase MoeA [Sansalvadorimonas sp. 2012CJ34-2]